MPKLRPYILTIAGFDPSGGAGILADIKTFEQCKTLGLAVNTAQTLQTEDCFMSAEPIANESIEKAVFTLLDRYPIKGIKIGWISDWNFLLELVQKIRIKAPKMVILWDPIAKATASPTAESKDWDTASKVLKEIDLLTPNYDELMAWVGASGDLEAWKKQLPPQVWVLQKGGHHPTQKGRDFLYQNQGKNYALKAWEDYQEKHGTGCILSAALLAYWIQDYPPHKAALKAKQYLKKAVFSNATKLSYHQ